MASNLVRMFVILGCFFRHGSQDLIVNVQSKNGDISQQEFKAFPEEDLVFLSYKLDDGQFIDISLDFKQVCVLHDSNLLRIARVNPA